MLIKVYTDGESRIYPLAPSDAKEDELDDYGYLAVFDRVRWPNARLIEWAMNINEIASRDQWNQIKAGVEKAFWLLGDKNAVE